MERLLTLIIICSYVVIFTGCAVKPIKSTQTINDLQVSLTETDENHYFLVDREKKVVSTSNGTNKLLKFPIPENINLDQCFSVLDKNGENFLSDKPKFRLSLIQDHRNLLWKKQDVERKILESKRQEEFHNNKYSETVSELGSNRAFINDSCFLPPQKTIPSEPTLDCKKNDSCFEEGKSICTEVFVKKKVCKFILGKFVPLTFGHPVCSATLTHENYEINHFFDDLEEGVWADLWRLFLGPLPFVYKTANELINFDEIITPCVDRYIDVQNNNLKTQWRNTVAGIEAEPNQTKNKCISLLNDRNHYYQKIRHFENNSELETSNLKIINREIGYLALKNSEVNKCND